jgi:enamine deaminase RidA (YjgF/YER057c/UK114 family)
VRLHAVGGTGAAENASVGEQAARCFAELSAGLHAAGASVAHVLSVTVWLAEFGDKPAFNVAWRRWLGDNDAVLPARAVVATQPADPRARLSVSCVAAAGTVTGPPSAALRRIGAPLPGLFHLAVEHNGVLYLSGVSAELETGDDDLSALDAAAQAAAVLARLAIRTPKNRSWGPR